MWNTESTLNARITQNWLDRVGYTFTVEYYAVAKKKKKGGLRL